MIRAMIFDLDGTLVQTERLKALSYALAVLDLCSDEITEATVIDAFTDVAGLPRRDVATSLVERFGLEDAAEPRMVEFGVSTSWQALVQLRLRYYSKMMSDPAVVRRYQWPHNVALLQQAQDTGCKTGLATMSTCAQTRSVTQALDLVDAFDFVATRDDAGCGKPDPEIYDLVSRELDILPTECLVIEDSPSGVKAALAAQMWCIVVTTPMTRKTIHTQQLLDERWVVDEPAKLTAVAARMLKERKGD